MLNWKGRLLKSSRSRCRYSSGYSSAFAIALAEYCRNSGLSAIWPVAAPIPVPDNVALAEVVSRDLHLLVCQPCMYALTATDPPSVPVVGGAKVTVTFMLCPGERVYGKFSALPA